MIEKSKNTGKINFSTIDMAPCNQPKIVERSGQDWIGYGNNNDYPEYLIDLYQNSSIDSALVKGIAAQIYGEGLDATDKDEKPEQWLQLQILLEKSQKDFLKNACFDLKLHGYCFLNVIWNRTRTKIAECKHIPAQTIRSGKADMSGIVDTYYYSADWADYRKGKYKPKGIKSFDLDDRTEASQLLMIKDYSPRVFYYSSPDYVGSTNWIQLDVQISDFHLNNISNGLFPSMSIAFNNGIPTDEARKEIERQLQQKFSGNQNAGRLMITFNDGIDNAPVINPINTNGADGLYQYLSTECVHKILSGHRITSPLLLGIRDTGGGFGNNADELRDSFDLLQGIVIQPFQETVLNSFKEILSVNAINLDVYFKTLKPAGFLDEEIVDVTSEDEAEKEGVSFSKRDMNEKEQEYYMSQLEEDAHNSNDLDEEWVLLDEGEAFDKEPNYWEFGIGHLPKGDIRDWTAWGSTNPMFRVFYRYSTGYGGGKSGKSRPFCRAMVRLSKGGAVYTREQIANLDDRNPDFAHSGNSYDVFNWKGGVFCYHKWLRVVYMRRRVPMDMSLGWKVDGVRYMPGELLPDTAIKYYKKSTQKALAEGGGFQVDDFLAGIRPIDTAGRGAYPGGRLDPSGAETI